jgi:hypothetical protein
LCERRGLGAGGGQDRLDCRAAIGGVLLRTHLPGYQLFYVAAIPLLFSAAFAYGLGRVARGWRHSGAAAAEQAR